MRKEYERYKPTGIEWISQIPAHWDWSFLSQVASEQKIKKPKDKMYPVMSLSYGQIIRKKNIDVGLVPASYDNYQFVSNGNIILRFTDLQNDHTSLRTGLVKEDGIITSAYTNIQPKINSVFLSYLLHAYDTMKIFYGMGGGVRQSIGFKDVRYLQIPVPPGKEQDQIMRFLDWKVSSINKLISNYRHQIELFDEMKQRKIDEAVFKGMRKSKIIHNNDIRWDIDYPEYWQIRRTRESFSFRKGLSITKANLEEAGVAVISYGQVHSKKNTGFALNEDIFRYVNKSYLETNKNCLVEKGDFIFADTSEDVIGCGNCVYIDRDETIFAGYHSIIAHPSGSTNNKYLAYLFKSPTWRYQIRKKVNGVKVYSITQKMLKDAFILIPPSDEQEEIARYLDEICVKIDAALQKLEEKISNLHDLKIRLIADAVTGKIDVRNITVPEFEYVDDTADDDSEDESEENEDCNGEED